MVRAAARSKSPLARHDWQAGNTALLRGTEQRSKQNHPSRVLMSLTQTSLDQEYGQMSWLLLYEEINA